MRAQERTKHLIEMEVNATMKQCTLCNEHIEDVDFEFGEAVDLEGEYWHAECYQEYFGEILETV